MKLEGFPQDVALRDGITVVIKPLDVEEASAVLKFYRSSLRRTGSSCATTSPSPSGSAASSPASNPARS